MIDFIKKTLLMMIFGFLLCIVTYAIAFRFKNNHTSENTIFIWGDSQIYQGIDLELLSKLTQKKVLSAAKHGAGVYDFLIFTEKVPANSTVLVAVSKPAQIRKKSRDRNKSGLSITALYDLIENDYSFFDILRIVKRNFQIKPPKLFKASNRLYEYKNEIVITQPISLFENSYKRVPEYLKSKQYIYLKGIEKLQSKGCIIHFIEFPYHSILSKIEANSPVNIHTEKFKKDICLNMQMDSILIEDKREIFHDLTHLNVIGANHVTKDIAIKINELNNSCFFIVH